MGGAGVAPNYVAGELVVDVGGVAAASGDVKFVVDLSGATGLRYLVAGIGGGGGQFAFVLAGIDARSVNADVTGLAKVGAGGDVAVFSLLGAVLDAEKTLGIDVHVASSTSHSISRNIAVLARNSDNKI